MKKLMTYVESCIKFSNLRNKNFFFLIFNTKQFKNFCDFDKFLT